MATRSLIAIQYKKDQCLAVYCHWDGYPENQMPILTEYYNSGPAIRKLLKGGDLSCLRTTTTWALKERREKQPLYFRERGDKGIEARQVKLTELRNTAYNCDAEHVYLYRHSDGWIHWRTEDLTSPLYCSKVEA